MSTETSERNRIYWQKNLKLVGVLLVAWFLVSYGCSILWVDQLDKVLVGQAKLGFWMAQQGSIYAFVIIIFIYVKAMNRIEDNAFTANDDSSEGGES